MSELLDLIKKPNDIKMLAPQQYDRLAKEIRKFLVYGISKTGGHLASNLGAVELTMALHLAMNFPEDKLVFDVGHQSYTHKILTGRKDDFAALRCYEGMSGFPKRKESDCDAFDTGHSSTSLSVAAGLAKARDLSGASYKVAAVIGDGALSGGMAYEALNNADMLKSNMLIVLNDNRMSISENVGGMATYLGKLRTNRKYTEFKGNLEKGLKSIPFGENITDVLKRSKDSIKHLMVQGMLFEDMGITYIGPIDGHNIELMVEAFSTAFQADGAVLVHVITEKGKGYRHAEKDPSRFHGVDPFDVKTGKPKKEKTGVSYTEVFSDKMVSLAEQNDKLLAISAAMPLGTGLDKFQKLYPERFFDVGIAEEHAVTFAAGLAAGGYRPVVAIYSTFLQRAYDQIVHDVCVGSLPVIFAIDRAGIVGNDGETHQGIFDLSYLSHIPGLTVMAPKNKAEFEQMLAFATEFNAPVAIRYPRGAACLALEEYEQLLVLGKSEMLVEENGIALVAVGSMVNTAMQVHDALKEVGIASSVVNMRFVTPLDEELLLQLANNHSVIVTMEENVQAGGFGEKIAAFYQEKGVQIRQMFVALPNAFLEHGEVSILKEKVLLTSEAITERIQKFVKEDSNG